MVVVMVVIVWLLIRCGPADETHRAARTTHAQSPRRQNTCHLADRPTALESAGREHGRDPDRVLPERGSWRVASICADGCGVGCTMRTGQGGLPRRLRLSSGTCAVAAG